MIYLDHAAATPVSPRALEAMEPYWRAEFFNPSAAYLPAKKVADAYERAKAEIAHAIGAKGADLIMTGSATEANNLAFTAVGESGEVIACATEHASVLEVAKNSSQRLQGSSSPKTNARNTDKNIGNHLIAVDRSGRVDLVDLARKITPRTELISIALVNNELGVIQPLSEVAALVRKERLRRLKHGDQRPLYLHTDASQALNLLDVNVARLGVDLMTLNSAKVYGPKGVGALFAAPRVRLRPLSVGGGQERGLRAGTENVPGVIGFAAALTEAQEHLANNRKKYAHFKQILLKELQGYELINRKHSLDNFVVLCYNGIDAERLLYKLEEKGVYVATGAACAASKGQRSHVLAAIGLSSAQIAGSLRLTLGEANTEEQMHEVARIINEVVAEEYARLEASGAKHSAYATDDKTPDTKSSTEARHA